VSDRATPGVRVEFTGARQALSGRRTDITGFVGIARRGPLFTPVRVESWGDFLTVFGAHTPSGYLAYGVQAFFANGGRTAWVVRMAHEESAQSATLPLAADGSAAAMTLTAAWADPPARTARPNPGVWANGMTATVTRNGGRFDLTIRAPGGVTEVWRDLGFCSPPRRAADVLNDEVAGSRLVSATVPDCEGSALPVPRGPMAFCGGTDGLADLTFTDLRRGLEELERVDEIALLAVPDLQSVPVRPVASAPPPRRCDLLDAPAQAPTEPDPAEFPPPLDVRAGTGELIAQCERTQDRFAILDPPREAADPAAAMDWRRGLASSAWAAAYFPWLLVPDPLRPAGELVRSVPPSGHVAGVYARTDREVGVHKAPANEALELAADVGFPVDDVVHGQANAVCLNVIRTHAGRGIRVSGARTLACSPPWRFVNVRRLVAMIQQTVAKDLAWAVFQPNDARLWAEVDRSVRGFLDGLWRQGMLDGATAAEAFDVRCDAETNPPDLVDSGRLSCLVALRPPPPAEFVVVRVTLDADGLGATGAGGSRA
jgi:hypothetical protein